MKKKMNLSELSVKSFVTDIAQHQQNTIRGASMNQMGSCVTVCSMNETNEEDCQQGGGGLTANCYGWSSECVSVECDQPVTQ